MNSRDKILSKIRAGKSIHRPSSIMEPDWNEEVFPVSDNLLETFVSELTQISGRVTLVESEADFRIKLHHEFVERGWKSIYCLDRKLSNLLAPSDVILENGADKFLEMEVGLTQCEALVARSGTVVISSQGDSGRRMNVYPPIHIIYATASQLVPFLKDAIERLESKYGADYPSLISFVTGASRTADIEKTLVMGAHGPKELHLFVNINI